MSYQENTCRNLSGQKLDWIRIPRVRKRSNTKIQIVWCCRMDCVKFTKRHVYRISIAKRRIDFHPINFNDFQILFVQATVIGYLVSKNDNRCHYFDSV